MKVFISYATCDLPAVRQLAARLTPAHQPIFWDADKVPSKPAWATIQGWIDGADVVVAMLSEQGGTKSPSVNQEIGYAIKAKKRVVPIVGANVPHADLAMLGGLTYTAMGALEPMMEGVLKAIQAEKDGRVQIIMALLLVAFVIWFLKNAE